MDLGYSFQRVHAGRLRFDAALSRITIEGGFVSSVSLIEYEATTKPRYSVVRHEPSLHATLGSYEALLRRCSSIG